jgi:hypothetical protein
MIIHVKYYMFVVYLFSTMIILMVFYAADCWKQMLYKVCDQAWDKSKQK